MHIHMVQLLHVQSFEILARNNGYNDVIFFEVFCFKFIDFYSIIKTTILLL